MKVDSMIKPIISSTVCVIMIFLSITSYGQWVKKSDIPGFKRSHIQQTSANGKIYVGGGYSLTANTNELWEYDPAVDKWTQKKDIPGSNNRSFGIAFSINGKVYMGLGQENFAFSSTTQHLKDLWEYDPAVDKWTQKASIPTVGGHANATVFTINNKAYIAGGYQPPGSKLINDLWEYDVMADKWTQKTDLPYTIHSGGGGFSINGKGYIFAGQTQNLGAISNKLYQYDPAIDTWTEKKELTGKGTYSGVAFVINDIAYCGLGSAIPGAQYDHQSKTFHAYNASTDSWTTVSEIFPDLSRGYCLAQVINNKAYVGMGWRYDGSNVNVFGDLYEFTPPSLGLKKSDRKDVIITCFPNPSSNYVNIKVTGLDMPSELRISNMIGETMLVKQLSKSGNVRITNIPSGIYLVKVFIETSKSTYCQKLIVH